MYKIKFVLNSLVNFVDMPYIPREGEGVSFRYRKTEDNAIFCKVISIDYWVTDGVNDTVEIHLENIDE